MDESDDDFVELGKRGPRCTAEAGGRRCKSASWDQPASSTAKTRSKQTQASTCHPNSVNRTKSVSDGTPGNNQANSPEHQMHDPPAPPCNSQVQLPCDDVSRPANPKPPQQLATARVKDGLTGIFWAKNSSRSQKQTTSRLGVKERVLGNMQQFRRREPERMRHCNVEETQSAPAVQEDEKRKIPSSLNPSQGNSEVQSHPPAESLPVTFTSDDCQQSAASTVSLPWEFQEEMGAAVAYTLEDKGLFFCLICQKDLSNMNSVRCTQHINRCLDEGEQRAAAATSSTMPLVPECPICGKQFKTFNGRVSHLKRCASEMEVPPQLLLEAVQRQNSKPPENSAPSVSVSVQPGRLKRKGSTREHQATKKCRQQTDEDTMVAMALSASLLEQERREEAEQANNFNLPKMVLAADRKGQKKRKDGPSMLLVQDPDLALRRVQDRLSLLLSEEREGCRTPPLPASTFSVGGVLRRVWYVRPGAAEQDGLWCRSALSGTGDTDPALFYTSDLVPPIIPWKPQQERDQELPDCKEPTLSSAISTKALARTNLELACAPSAPGSKTEEEPVVRSQQERAFFDLMDLAGEGMTLTQWDSEVKYRGSTEATGSKAGSDSPMDDIVPSGFVSAQSEGSCENNLQLGLRKLMADLGEMVNNPHLSDVQFQVDSGEVVYAHQFILYARSPQLAQTVHSEGLLVEEDDAAETRRLLLPEVTAQAVLAFLHYLYTASVSLSPAVCLELRALAKRFAVSELEEICRAYSVEADPAGESSAMEDEEYGSREDNLQDLLRSMWMDEVEEPAFVNQPAEGDEADEVDEGVGDEDLDELYEFAATQRKIERTSLQKSERLDQKNSAETGGETGASGENEQSEEELRTGSKAAEDSFVIENVTASDSQHLLKPLEVSYKVKTFQLKELHSLEADVNPNTSDCLFSETDISVELQHDVNFGETHESGPSSTDKTFNRKNSLRDSSSANCSITRISPICEIESPSACLSLSDLPVVGLSPVETNEKSTPCQRSASALRTVHHEASGNVSTSSRQPHLANEECDVPGVPWDCAGQKSPVCLEEEWLSKPEPPSVSAPLSMSAPHTHEMQQCDLASPISINSSPSASESKSIDVLVVIDSDEEMGITESEVTRPSSRSVPLCSGPSPAGKSDVLSVYKVEQQSSRVDGVPSKSWKIPSPELSSVAKERGHKSRDADSESELTLQLSSDSEPNPDPNAEHSWLVPATPLPAGTAHCSTQTEHTCFPENQTAGRGKLFEKPVDQETTTLKADGGSQEKAEAETVNPQKKVLRYAQEINQVGELVCFEEGDSVGQSLSDSPPLTPFPLTQTSDCVVELESEDTSVDCSPSAQPESALSVSLCSEGKEAKDTSVLEIVDTEEETPTTGAEQFHHEPPLPFDDEFWTSEGSPRLEDEPPDVEEAFPHRTTAQVKDWEEPHPVANGKNKSSTPLPGRSDPSLSSPSTGGGPSGGAGDNAFPRRQDPSFLDSRIWDDWEEEDEFPEVLRGFSQKQPVTDCRQRPTEHKPSEPVAGRRGHRSSAPITPEPPYSTMATPCLKRELGKFGVRPMPKRKMILKLREIYEYTHRTVQPDSARSEQQVSSSQPCGQKPKPVRVDEPGRSAVTQSKTVPSGSKGLKLRSTSAAGNKRAPGARPKAAAKRGQCGIPGALGTEAQSPVTSEAVNQLSSSQSSSSSAVSGDSSRSERLSEGGFDDVFSADSGDEEDDGVTSSQAVVREADTTKAIRQFIQSNPSLYCEILQYKPFELSDFHQQLKDNDIKVSKGKLVEFLDAQCITFTTARARKALKQRRKLGTAKRCRGKPGHRKKRAQGKTFPSSTATSI